MSAPCLSVPLRMNPDNWSKKPHPPGNRTANVVRATPDHLSWSQCKAFAACPLQWWLSRRFAPKSVASGLMFGSGFHAAVEAYYRAQLQGEALALPDLLAAFDRHWAGELDGRQGRAALPIQWSAKEEDAAGARELAERMLAAFLEERERRPSLVVAVEEPFRIVIGPDVPPLVGRIDLLEIRIDDDGIRRLHVVDWKTAAKRPSPSEIGSDQLHLYAMAASDMRFVRELNLPLALRVEVVTKTKRPEVVTLAVEHSPKDVARLAETIRHYWRAMSAGVHYPVSGWRCSGCGHAARCASWPETMAAEALPDMRISA